MTISKYHLKSWMNMLKGKSVHHVNQNMGRFFDPSELKGYFNNLTEKVTKDEEHFFSNNTIPIDHEPNGDFYFPVGVFQYALGIYDLFLSSNDNRYKDYFIRLANWAIENQDQEGRWNNFFFRYPEHPYGAMAQGQGASVLLRAYVLTNDDRFLLASKKALDYMLLPLEHGGTTKFIDNEMVLLEYTHLPPVLNGWVFAAFGLYDYWLVSKDNYYKNAFDKTVATIKNRLSEFDNGYWSKYDLAKKITSPFYHNLHIWQMKALYLATNDEIFEEYHKKWMGYQKKAFNRLRAFVKKAFQKLFEKDGGY